MAFDTAAAWFCYQLHAGRGLATATTSDTDADDGNLSPVANILDRYTFRQWQSPSEDDWFEIDFSVDVSIQCLFVVFPRITDPRRYHETQEIISTDEIQHFLDADGGTPGTGAILDTGLIACGVNPKRGYHVIVLESAVSARYWRCRIKADSRASEGFFLVMLADAGPVFQPSFNHIYGESLGFPDNAETQRTPTSQTTFITRNERTLTARLIWDFIPDSERASWETMDEYAGTTEPIVFGVASCNPSAFTSDTGPNGWVIEGDKVFLGLRQGDLETSSRELNANIKQIQLTEHR